VVQAGGSFVSSGRPRRLPLGSHRVEPCLAAGLEHDDLCRTRCLLGACRDPDEVQVHLRSSLSLMGAARRPSSSPPRIDSTNRQWRCFWASTY
jgi:hypothetical protein